MKTSNCNAISWIQSQYIPKMQNAFPVFSKVHYVLNGLKTLNITPLTWKYHCGKVFGRPLISGIGNNVPSLELHDRTGLIIFQQRLVVYDTKEA